MKPLGIGIGWRQEIDLTVERLRGVDFVEVTAEHLDPRALPQSLHVLRERGTPIAVHALSLSLGGAEPLEPRRVDHLAAVAAAVAAPVVSEHIAFTRAGGLDTGHLLPLPRTRAALDVLVSNVRAVAADLPAPLALENIACLFCWPHEELTEIQFLCELLERTDVHLLLDVANLYANGHNLGTSIPELLAALPTERLAYLHVAGGLERDGLYHDTHAHPVGSGVLDLLETVCSALRPGGVLLERDQDYGSDAELAAELASVRRIHDRAAQVRA